MIDGLLREEQAVGDVRIPQPPGDKCEHFLFPGGEVRGVLARCRTRSAWEAAHATFAEPARDDRCGLLRAQSLKLAVCAKRVVIVRFGERECGLVGTAELAPHLGCA